jgi:predicted acyltransferase
MAELTAPAIDKSAAQTASAPKLPQRLTSVDALRGFDMFWIIGADSLVYALHRLSENPITNFLGVQLEHCDWAGFHFYDLIFPLFVFIMGVSVVFSLSKTIEQKGRTEAVKRIFRRTILLFIVALIYSGGERSPWPDIRLLGVLNRIALCYFFGGLAFCFLKPRAMVGLAVALLVGYWAIMTFVPIRDIRMAHYKQEGHELVANDVDKIMQDTGVKDPAKIFYNTTNWVTAKYDMGYNVANHLDFKYLGGRKYDTYWDPEGLLSTMPAVVTCLLGIFAGLLLKSANYCDKWKVIYLISLGAAGVILGFLWGLQFPVVKKIWTSSFVLVAGGFSAILLGVFYQVVDVWKYQKWCQPFIWMGMNSITIYLASNFLGGFRSLGVRIAGGDVKNFFDLHLAKGAGDMIIAITGLLLAFWFVHFLYRRKIFLRL